MKNSSLWIGLLVALTVSVLALVGWPERARPGGAASAAPTTAQAWSLPEGYWGSATYGVAMMPPAGWTETRRQKRDYLDRVPNSPVDGNFCVLTVPNMLGLDFEALVAENRSAFETMPGLELVTMDLLEIAGRDVIRTEYHATHQTTGDEYHCLGLAFLRGGQQVILTMTIAADQWDEQREVAEAAIGSVVLQPR